MDLDYYEHLARAIAHKYEAAVAKAEAERENDLKALQRMRQLFSLPETKQNDAMALTLHTTFRAFSHGLTRYQSKKETVQDVSEEDLPWSIVYPATPRGELKEAVQRAIATLPEPFTTNDVEQWIKMCYPALSRTPQASISSALRRFAIDEVLMIVKQGAGQAPTVFKRNRERGV